MNIFRAAMLRDQPITRDRNAIDALNIVALLFLPSIEIDRAREGSEHDELREREVRVFGERGGRFKRFRLVRG